MNKEDVLKRVKRELVFSKGYVLSDVDEIHETDPAKAIIEC